MELEVGPLLIALSVGSFFVVWLICKVLSAVQRMSGIDPREQEIREIDEEGEEEEEDDEEDEEEEYRDEDFDGELLDAKKQDDSSSQSSDEKGTPRRSKRLSEKSK